MSNATPVSRFRRAVGWTQAEMARALGISRQRVWMYEHGWHQPRPDVARRLVDLSAAHGHPVTLEEIYAPAECATDSAAGPREPA